MGLLEEKETMAADPTKVEFLEYCRLILKEEEPAAGLKEAIAAARTNLERLKSSFLEHVASLSEPVREKCARETEEAVAAIDMYFSSVDIVEGYLADSNRVTLIRGMEFVRRALERINLAFYRYRTAVLASEGPTDMPNYNLFHKLVHDYQEGKIGEKELKNLIQAARYTVEQAMTAGDRFKQIPEVERLNNAFQKHQESLTAIEEAIGTNKPLDKELELFRERCEALRDLQGPAQMKILSQGPTPSEVANRMINISMQVLTGRIHRDYLTENLKQLEGEYDFFRRQFETLQSAATPREAEMLKDAFQESKTGMELYEKAISEFHRFEERMEIGILVGAVKILQDAVLKLYNVYKLVSEMSEREGKIICLRCQHYNAPERRNCESCGAVLPRMAENQADQSRREVRDALLSMPLTENVKTLLEAGEGVIQGAISRPDFQQLVARMEDLIDQSLKQADEFWRTESKKRKDGFSENEENAYSLLKNGSREMLDGLSFYKRYLEAEDAGLIREGARRIVLGAHKVYQIGRFGMQVKN